MKKNEAANVTIATVFQNLVKREFVTRDPDDALVINALRRSKSSLSNASPSELGDYLEKLNEKQLRGVASNVKGIYHELKFVDHIDSSESGLHAEIFGATNHPGADIRIINAETGQLVRELQLKATESTQYIQEHIDRYPHIDVAATFEVAERMQGIESTPFSNTEMASITNNGLDNLSDLSFESQVEASVETSGLINAAHQAHQVLTGKKKMGEASKDALTNTLIATSTTALVAWLFS